MKLVMAVIASAALLGAACKKDSTGGNPATGGSGSASGSSAPAPVPPTPVAAVSCSDATKAYASMMWGSPGNEWSDLKKDKALNGFVAVTIEEDCDAGWSAETKACVAAVKTEADAKTCPEYARVAGALHQVVTEMKAKDAAGSGSAATP